MITFTEVDGVAYPGTLIREGREHSVYGFGFFGYLSANVNGRWISVERWEPDGGTVTEAELRDALVSAIRERTGDRWLTN